MKTLTVPAELGELDHAIQFVLSELEHIHCPAKTQNQMAIVVEEVFVNIAHYAYNPDIGEATIRCAVGGSPLQVTIEFLDAGKPYDPLKNDDPDVTLSAEQRSIGGLGIFMVKRLVDDIKYEYREGKNILTVRKQV